MLLGVASSLVGRLVLGFVLLACGRLVALRLVVLVCIQSMCLSLRLVVLLRWLVLRLCMRRMLVV